MRKIFFTLITILSINMINITANAEETKEPAGKIKCSQIVVSPELDFTTSYGELVYDFDKSVTDLTNMGKGYGIVEQGLFAAGLATVNVNWELTMDSIAQILGENEYCVVPAKVSVFIGYEDPKIYVSKHLKKDSCEYNVVLRHEQTHQQINKLALDYFIPKMKLAIEEISKDIKPVEVRDLALIDAVSEDMNRHYINNISPLVEYFKKELLNEHAKLDNHENYNLENNICVSN